HLLGRPVDRGRGGGRERRRRRQRGDRRPRPPPPPHGGHGNLTSEGADAPPPASLLLPPHPDHPSGGRLMATTPHVLLDRYEVGRLLGAGGMAEVFEGHDRLLA